MGAALFLLATAVLAGGCGSQGTVPLRTLPTGLPEPDDHLIAAIGSEAGHAQSVVVANTDSNDFDAGALTRPSCIGQGHLIIAIYSMVTTGRESMTVPCTGRWEPGLALGIGSDDHGPFQVTAKSCGDVRSWVVDVIGTGTVGSPTDTGPVPDPSLSPAC